jgi:hypothetical protein
VEIHHWFLCDCAIIVFFGCKLYSWQLSPDVRVSCGFLFVCPLELLVVFGYLVIPFVRFLSSVEEPEAAALFLLKPNDIHLLDYFVPHGQGHEGLAL